MATLNVVDDYGAVGDGTTDDAGAIQQAINETNDGDTVLIPEQSSGFYRIYDDTTGTSTRLLLENAAKNVTITGESRDSKLVMDSPDGKAGIMGCDDMSNAAWTSINIKKLVLDGGNTEFNDTDSNAMSWRVSQNRTGYDVLVEDVVMQNTGGSSGFTMGNKEGMSKFTFRNCTANNNGNHGFDPVGTGEGSPSDPEIKFYDIEASNNSGIAIDFHSGNHLLDGFYGTGNENGMKAGAAGGPVNHITMKNVNHRNSGNKGFYQTFSQDGTWGLELGDCLFVGHDTDGLELREECICTVTGTVMVDDSADSDDNIQILEGTDFDATNGIIISQNATNGYGIYSGFSDHGGQIDIDTYYHYNNAAGAKDGGTPINVTNQINEQKSEIDVPQEDEVGAFVNTKTEVSDDLVKLSSDFSQFK